MLINDTRVEYGSNDIQGASLASYESNDFSKRAANLPQAGGSAVKWSLLIANAGSHLTAPPSLWSRKRRSQIESLLEKEIDNV